MNQTLLIANFISPITGVTWAYKVEDHSTYTGTYYQVSLLAPNGTLRNFGFVESTEQDVIDAKLLSMLENLERYNPESMHSRFD